VQLGVAQIVQQAVGYFHYFDFHYFVLFLLSAENLVQQANGLRQRCFKNYLCTGKVATLLAALNID
jgi:hypothetical protein